MTSNFLTLHAVHAVPASLLNRDDMGAAKTIQFGGTNRVRISSQAWKRAIREALREVEIAGGTYGQRTNWYPRIVAGMLVEKYSRDADVAHAKTLEVFKALAPKGLSITDKGSTSASFFAGPHFPESVAELIDEHWDVIGGAASAEGSAEAEPADSAEQAPAVDAEAEPEKQKKQPAVPAAVSAAALAALCVGTTVDLALMGRMLAEVSKGGRIDGAVGVAHAFGVDPAAIEPDFFTAVDDAAEEGESMAGNLGVTQISAPVLYRSASLDRRQLRRNLAGADNPEELAAAAEAAFIDMFIRAVPAAKARSTVASTLPSIVMVAAGPQVVSAADAFADAVRSDNVLDEAVARLAVRVHSQKQFIPNLRVHTLAIGQDLPAVATANAHTNTADFLAAVASA